MKSKEVWFECPSCHLEHYDYVQCEIDKKTGGLKPLCRICGTRLVRRVKRA